MRKEGYENWGSELPHFVEFWSFLNDMADSEARCSCREGKCEPPFCGIRKCAQEKSINVCPFCEEYPCQKIMGYGTMLADAQRMKTIGFNAWTQEQEERKDTGFCYADVRIYPYEVPVDQP